MVENIENEEYIKFAKVYFEKTIIDRIKEINKNNELTIDSKLIDEYGKIINLKEEITEFIDVLGDELIKDFDTITTKIDDYFFDYSNKKLITKENFNVLKDEVKNLEEEIEKTEIKALEKIERFDIEKTKKDDFIKITKELFLELKNKISKFINKFKNQIENKNIIDNEIKYELLKSDNLSSSILDKLANDEDISTLRKIAIHKNTNEKTLEKIFNNTNDFKVIENLLRNDNTPTKIVDELSKNNDKDIVLLSLEHKNISENILNKYSQSKDLDVINSILGNENISEKVLENIIKSDFKDKEILNKISKVIQEKQFTDEKFINKTNKLNNEYLQGTLIQLENIENKNLQNKLIGFIKNINENGDLAVILQNGENITVNLETDKLKKVDMKNLPIITQFNINKLKQQLFKNDNKNEKLEKKINMKL